MVAPVLGRSLEVRQGEASLIAPPRMQLPVLDLVTEGTVTLNQVCNILSADIDISGEPSGVTELCCLLRVADRIHFQIGQADNPAGKNNIAFEQQGLLRRRLVVDLLSKRLEATGKLVVTDTA